MKLDIPAYWKSELSDIKDILETIKKGTVEIAAKSAGGRDIYTVKYGKPNNLNRSANLSSALGARNIKYFADKTGEEYRPTAFFVGGVHGGEFEGVVALLNLINIIENGVDFAGYKNTFLQNIVEKYKLIIIPCVNPDGRARIPHTSLVDCIFEEFRFYDLGTWKDGTLCNWPDCKKIHPIKDAVDFLGGYFNDDGINMMHDNFFGNKSAETALVLDIAETYVPDITILLHGGTNSKTHIIKPSYVPMYIKEKIFELENKVKERAEAEGMMFNVLPIVSNENKMPPISFGLNSAIHHICGEISFTYESNQGLNYEGDRQIRQTYEQMYRQHIILFEEAFKLISGVKD